MAISSTRLSMRDRRRFRQRSARASTASASSQHGGLDGLRLRAGITVRTFRHVRPVRISARFARSHQIEILHQRRTVVLFDKIHDRLRQNGAAAPQIAHP